MNATTTWAAVHVGDTVRGADQRVWSVIGREAVAGTWIGSGVTEARFRLALGSREIVARRDLAQPAPLVGRADHTDIAAAWAALTAGLGPLELLQEETMTTTATADPFTSPAVEVKRDRYGRYLLPDPTTGKERAWTRATTVARTLADEYNLTLWKLRQVAKGMSLRPDLIAGAAAADPDGDKRTLDEIAEKAMERAGSSSGATLGTALHSFTQRLDGGEPLASLGAPAPLDKDLVAYTAALKLGHLTVRPEWIERIVVLPDLGIAGTLDRIVEQPAGVTKAAALSVLDLKTGKDLQYSWLEIAIQQAIYARAPLLWNQATGTYETMPVVDQDRALVLHLPVGKAQGQIYGVNIIEGWEFVQLAMKVRGARSMAKGLAWLVEPDRAALLRHNVSRATREELARLWEVHHPRGEWTEEIHALATARMTALTAEGALAS